MKLIIPGIKSLAILPAAVLLAATAQAQIGSGWTVYNPSQRFEYESNDVLKTISPPPSSFNNGYCAFTRTSKADRFQLLTHNSNRAEIRFNDDYSSGSRQFQADVLIKSPSTGECIHQIFNGPTGPWLLLKETSAYNGSLHMGGATASLATNLYGHWFRLNSINDMNTGRTYFYVNGVQVWSGSNPGGTFYTKYGAYGTHDDAHPADITFSNVVLYTGGSASGGGGFPGWYQINDHNSGKDAAVHYAATTNGADVILWTFGSAQNDQWELTPTDSGYYKVVNRHSGKVMAVQSASTSRGAKVIQWDFGSAQNDQWMPVAVGSYYKFVNRHSGLVLDVTGAYTTNGTPFEQWDDNGGNNQQFQLISTP